MSQTSFAEAEYQNKRNTKPAARSYWSAWISWSARRNWRRR